MKYYSASPSGVMRIIIIKGFSKKGFIRSFIIVMDLQTQAVIISAQLVGELIDPINRAKTQDQVFLLLKVFLLLN
jgi:hypothetical protein